MYLGLVSRLVQPDRFLPFVHYLLRVSANIALTFLYIPNDGTNWKYNTVNAEASYKMRGICLKVVISNMSFLTFLASRFSATSINRLFQSTVREKKKKETTGFKKKIKHGQGTDMITVA